MTRSIYIIGPPASGKSTLMRALLSGWLVWGPEERVWREVYVTHLLSSTGAREGLSLGRERGAFSGTDALSMSVQPRALEWLREADLPPWVVGEGARLSSPKFLCALDARAPLTLVYLEVSEETAAARRATRPGDKLSDTFVKQARTRAANAAQTMEALGYPVLRIPEVPTEDQVDLVVQSIRRGTKAQF